MSVAGRVPYEDAEYFLQHSPFRNADAIQTPLLLMHGLADQNVRPEESMQLFTALRSRGKPVEMVLFPGEVHGIGSTLSARANQRGMMLDWFDYHLRGETEAWTERWEKE
jgi:acylaminoacyl-peptidase